MIHPFIGTYPRFDESNFIAPSADVIGDVTLGAGSSIWFNATVRGDVNFIRIGKATNIQDNCVVHVTHGDAPAKIGDFVTAGHGAIIHGCTVRDRVLVGMGAVVLDQAVIGRESIVGAGSLVTQRTRIPPRSMVLGSPARVVRRLSDREISSIIEAAEHYLRYTAIYLGKETPKTNPYY